MIRSEGTGARNLLSKLLKTDLVVIGGGLSGVCAAITAAREGMEVVLVQDRPVLGGNSSSEVRLWVLGATSHMGNNNRWSREGGVIDEILVENTYRNKEGNPLLFDTLLLDKVLAEKRITLLLNTAVYEVHKNGDQIASVTGFCSQNSTMYSIEAPLFCDASGDGVVGFLSGAAFRMGAESTDEFGEKFAPDKAYGELLGHSIYFYTKDIGKPVKFVAPEFALKNIPSDIPRFKNFNTKDFGCKLWWLEYGGRLDTVHDTEEIKHELWKVVYGVWDYIKNSGKFPEAETMTLEWVGTIPGKRESRRFEGDYMLRQQDIVEQHTHIDAVAYGGWSIDLHPADGVFSEKPGCNQWHSKGVYQIPYRCLYSKNVRNLFLAGRIISASHVAFASTRVMATAAHIGQAVGMAAVIATKKNLLPSDLLEKTTMETLQQALLKTGHHIPGLVFEDQSDLLKSAEIFASSEYLLHELPCAFVKPLEVSIAQMLPLNEGVVPQFTFYVQSEETTTLEVELRMSSKAGNYSPDVILEQQLLTLSPGDTALTVTFSAVMQTVGYGFLVIKKNEKVQIQHSAHRVTGLLSVFNAVNPAVSNYGKQVPTEDIGVDEFEFWCPKRRPEGENLAFKLDAPLKKFGKENLKTGIYRPTITPNAWVAALQDPRPELKIVWAEPQEVDHITLHFDTDYDHPMETVLMGHPENVMPFCVRDYKIRDDRGELVYEKKGNYQTVNKVILPATIRTSSLTFEFEHPSTDIPVSVFSISCHKNF